MEYLQIIKAIHIVCGIAVGITGLLQILLRKGGKLHRITGRIYLWAWLPLVVTGGIIGSTLILLFGLFGYYMVLTGYGMARSRSGVLDGWFKVVIVLGTILGAVLAVWAMMLLVTGNINFGIIALVFGLLFFLTASKDMRRYILGAHRGQLHGHKMEWFFEHFIRMYISLIAATTAFSAIQELSSEPLVNWLAPTVIGTLLIILAQKKYGRKFKIDKAKN